MDETTVSSAAQPVKGNTGEGAEQETGPIDVTGSSPEIVSDDTTDDLKIVMGEFDGPLDLLLHLIRQEQVNIYDIPVARIANEYLRYLQLMQELDIAVAGDFLVMAATLIELKTRMLLPRDPFAPPEEEEDPRRELVDQLLEYQKYKAAAQMLWSRATVERAVFKRAEINNPKQLAMRPRLTKRPAVNSRPWLQRSRRLPKPKNRMRQQPTWFKMRPSGWRSSKP